MLFKDSALLDRIFRVFDVDDDNEIIFSEYLSCMSMISSKATKEEKLKCKLLFSTSYLFGLFTLVLYLHFLFTVSFQIYDFDGDGLIRFAININFLLVVT